ncbi:MAG: hypothetical protein NW208_02205 [Bryobacter sp.]|nr:hypothetical protein [Bryobacter sp.]
MENPLSFLILKTMSLEAFEKWIWALNQASVLALVLLLVLRKLQIDFRSFGLYLGVSAIVSMVLSYYRFVGNSDNAYATVYRYWAYIGPIFMVIAISELLHLTLGKFEIVLAASRTLLRSVWVGLAIFGLIWYFYLSSIAKLPQPRLASTLSYQQASTMAFAIFMLFLLLFISLMSVPLPPSRLWHSFLLGGWFFSIAISRLSYLLSGDEFIRQAGSIFAMLASSGICWLWIWKVRPDRDGTDFVTPQGTLTEEEVEENFERLEALNRSLGRSWPRFLR